MVEKGNEIGESLLTSDSWNRCESTGVWWGCTPREAGRNLCALGVDAKDGEVKMRITMSYQPGGRLLVAAVALTALAATVGCRVDEHRNGDHEDVKIATPFGGMSVKTNDATVQAGVGLALYPGATVVKKLHTDKDGEHDDGAADVNLSFGSFHLGVKALSYSTQDAPDKVMAFYRKDMARYGEVLLCKGKHAVGTPVETRDGLTCSDDSKNVHVQGMNVDTDGDGSYGVLKAGSKLHQHIVSIDEQGSGTKFGLVALDLPGHLGIEDKDSEQ